MRFFPYRPTVSSGKLWNLMSGVDQSKSSGRFENMFEAIRAGFNGNLDVDQPDFNHGAYEARSRKHEKVSKFKRSKKELHIVDDSTSDASGGTSVGYGDVREGVALKAYEAEFEQVIDSQALSMGIASLDRISEQMMFTTGGVNVLMSMENALQGHQEAISALVHACASDDGLKEQIADLLSAAADGKPENSLLDQIVQYRMMEGK